METISIANKAGCKILLLLRDLIAALITATSFEVISIAKYS